MPHLEKTGIGTVAVAVVLIIAAFLTATLTPMARIERIGADAAGIAGNAVPSIEELIEARRAISRIRLAFERAEHRPGAGGDRVELQRALDQLRKHVRTYLGGEPFPGERASWIAVRNAMAGVEDAMRMIGSTATVGELAAAGPPLAAALERADAVLLVAIEANAEQIRSFAAHIDQARTRSRRDALLLNGVSLILAGAMLAWSVRTLRQRFTAEREVQALLERRAAELDMFAARVAHDLVSPLTPAALWLERLQESPDERTRHAATRGLHGVHRTLSTVEGLLAFARAGQVAPTGAATEVAEVAREVIAELEEARVKVDASLELVAEGGPCRVAVHAGVLTSMLANLAGNALKYLGDVPVRKVTVAIAGAGDRVRIEVRDTGPGIPVELQARIFDPYFRAAAPGTTGLGLGLATVKRLVEAHRGRIGVTSAAGGSTFWIELPAAS